MSSWDDDENRFEVVANHEEQYSIWPVERALPPGWRAVGKSGNKAECQAYIREVWTDMRPLSLRNQMDGNGSQSQD
jgi:MbtH protein